MYPQKTSGESDFSSTDSFHRIMEVKADTPEFDRKPSKDTDFQTAAPLPLLWDRTNSVVREKLEMQLWNHQSQIWMRCYRRSETLC